MAQEVEEQEAPAWPTDELEPPVIGDRMYQELVREGLGNEAALYWEGSLRGPYRLYGTDLPGDIALSVDLASLSYVLESKPLDLSWNPPNVDDILRELCAGLHIWYPAFMPSLEDLSPYVDYPWYSDAVSLSDLTKMILADIPTNTAATIQLDAIPADQHTPGGDDID